MWGETVVALVQITRQSPNPCCPFAGLLLTRYSIIYVFASSCEKILRPVLDYRLEEDRIPCTSNTPSYMFLGDGEAGLVSVVP
jgi:hypothetical protein